MKYQIITFGCQMNESDSLRLGQYMERRGWDQTRNISEADLIFFNACSVRQSAVDRLYAKVKKIRSQNKNAIIILIGCILPKDKEKFLRLGIKIRRIEQLPLARVCHSEQTSRLYSSEMEVKNLGYNRRQLEMGRDPSPASAPLQRPQDNIIAYIPIMRGCNNWCSYCAVPLTKGRECCRPAIEIIEEVKKLVTAGYQEIMLLGQNVNSYRSPTHCHSESRLYSSDGEESQPRRLMGQTLPPSVGDGPGSFSRRLRLPQDDLDFADLLKIINNLPGNFKIRFMTNHPKDMSDKLIQTIAQGRKIVKEIHLPLQSGDNEILRQMNRHYTREQYLALIAKIKQTIPNVQITTDIIVGFPNETKAQFQQTADIIKKVGFAKAYISKYSPRPGTVASRLPDNIPMVEKKRREQILRRLI